MAVPGKHRLRSMALENVNSGRDEVLAVTGHLANTERVVQPTVLIRSIFCRCQEPGEGRKQI